MHAAGKGENCDKDCGGLYNQLTPRNSEIKTGLRAKQRLIYLVGLTHLLLMFEDIRCAISHSVWGLSCREDRRLVILTLREWRRRDERSFSRLLNSQRLFICSPEFARTIAPDRQTGHDSSKTRQRWNQADQPKHMYK